MYTNFAINFSEKMTHEELQKNLLYLSAIGLLVVAFWPRRIIEEKL